MTCACAMPSRTCRSFVLWDSEKRLVMSNPFQQLQRPETGAPAPGASYDNVMDAARNADGAPADAISQHQARRRTQHVAQLDDGRWLQINERRTKDAGFARQNRHQDQEPRSLQLMEPNAASWQLKKTRSFQHKLEIQCSNYRTWQKNMRSRRTALKLPTVSSRNSSPISASQTDRFFRDHAYGNVGELAGRNT
ncbi:MAG: hypothetical protein R3D29_00450 [Nitratireductor sp.]